MSDPTVAFNRLLDSLPAGAEVIREEFANLRDAIEQLRAERDEARAQIDRLRAQLIRLHGEQHDVADAVITAAERLKTKLEC